MVRHVAQLVLTRRAARARRGSAGSPVTATSRSPGCGCREGVRLHCVRDVDLGIGIRFVCQLADDPVQSGSARSRAGSGSSHRDRARKPVHREVEPHSGETRRSSCPHTPIATTPISSEQAHQARDQDPGLRPVDAGSHRHLTFRSQKAIETAASRGVPAPAGGGSTARR